MVDLSTEYLGMKLKNPVIAGSSGLTNSVKSIKELEENGAAAVFDSSLLHFMDEYKHLLQTSNAEIN